MSKLNLNTKDGLTRLMNEMNSILEKRIKTVELNESIDNVDNISFLECKQIFESISDKLYETKEGQKIIANYIRTIKSNAPLRALYTLSENIKTLSNGEKKFISNPSMFVTESINMVRELDQKKLQEGIDRLRSEIKKAIKEAVAYNGPSLIIGYAPCINHGIKGGMTDTQKVINENRDTLEAFKFYNVSVTTGDVCAAVFISREHIGKIIEIILTPMYNVKKYMADHWLEQIDKVVGAKIKEEIGTDETVSREEVQNYIYTFILAKYRLEMTGKPDQFTKILLKSISQFDVAKTSPARLLNIIDSLKLEEIDNNKGIKEMTQLAKAEIQKIAENKEVTPQDILKDIDALLSYGDKEDEEEQKPVSGEKNELFEEN